MRSEKTFDIVNICDKKKFKRVKAICIMQKYELKNLVSAYGEVGQKFRNQISTWLLYDFIKNNTKSAYFFHSFFSLFFVCRYPFLKPCF